MTGSVDAWLASSEQIARPPTSTTASWQRNIMARSRLRSAVAVLRAIHHIVNTPGDADESIEAIRITLRTLHG